MHFWNNMPEVSHEELKSLLKKSIWSWHWKKDVAAALCKESPFSMSFLKHAHLPTFPYKTKLFLDHFNTKQLTRTALSMVLRFWMTPNRYRVCSCNQETNQIAKHLLFSCPLTRDQMAFFSTNIPPELSLLLSPAKLPLLLRKILNSTDLFKKFNLLISKFDYPRY